MHKLYLFAALILLSSTGRADFLFERAGGLAYYDWHQDITWMQDANYAFTSGYDSDGRLPYDQALIYMDYLNTIQHLGVGTWRLPVMAPLSNGGEGTFSYCGTDKGHNLDPASGELAFMYYETLGLQSKFDCNGQPQTPHGVTYSGPFSNINNNETQAYTYGTEYALNTTRAWALHFEYGGQHPDGKAGAGAIWPVFTGDLLYAAGDPLPISLILDVLPWNAANEIDPAADILLPVTLFGSASLDGGDIDLSTVRFGPSKAMSAGDIYVGDRNGDTIDDLSVHFNVQDTGIVCGDTEVMVYGENYTEAETEVAFVSVDSITTVDCDTGGCHP